MTTEIQKLIKLKPSDNPKAWLGAIHDFFKSIATQSEIEIIATYQTFTFLQQKEVDSGGDLYYQIGICKNAAVARMVAIIRSQERSKRRSVRKSFEAVIGHSLLFA